MKIEIIIETKEYRNAWNAFHFAITAKKQGPETKRILMGEAVEFEGLAYTNTMLTNNEENVQMQVMKYLLLEHASNYSI